MTKTIPEITADILLNPMPIIFIDTCSILDLVRVIQRENISANLIEHSKHLHTQLNPDDPKYWLLGSTLTIKEWDDNIDGIVSSSNSSLLRTYQILVKYNEVAKQFSRTLATIETSDLFVALTEDLKQISKDFYDSFIQITYDDTIMLKATNRMINNLAPASKGKSEPKDCIIIEIAEECCAKLRENGFNKEFVFVTSNIKDFGEPNNLFTPLDIEFTALNMKLASNLAHARSITKI